MCYWASNFFKGCSHQPLILQNFCHKVTVTDGGNLKYTLGFKHAPSGRSPKGKYPPKRLIRPHRSGVDNTVEDVADEPIRMAKLCPNFHICGSCELDDVCPDCRDEELPSKQKQEALAELIRLEKMLEANGITWDLVVESLDAEVAPGPYSFAHLSRQIHRSDELGMAPIVVHGAPFEHGRASHQGPVPRELIDHRDPERGGFTPVATTFIEHRRHASHPGSLRLANDNVGHNFLTDPVFSPHIIAFPSPLPTPSPISVMIPQVFPENPQPLHRYSGIFSPSTAAPCKLVVAAEGAQEQRTQRPPQHYGLHHKRSQSNFYHPNRNFSEVKSVNSPHIGHRSHVSQGSSSFQDSSGSRIPHQLHSQPQPSPHKQQSQRRNQSPKACPSTDEHDRNCSVTASSKIPNAPITPFSLPPPPQTISNIPSIPKTPSMARLYSSGVVISPPGQRRQVELEFAKARDREVARQRERERELELEAEAMKKRMTEQAEQAEMQMRVEREMQALERYRSMGMVGYTRNGGTVEVGAVVGDDVNPQGWIDASGMGVVGKGMNVNYEDHEERRKLAQVAWERAIGWHR